MVKINGCKSLAIMAGDFFAGLEKKNVLSQIPKLSNPVTMVLVYSFSKICLSELMISLRSFLT